MFVAPEETIEWIGPDKELLSLLVEVMEQNNTILKMNELIVKVAVSTPVIVKATRRDE